MNDPNPQEPKIVVDDDWKSQVQQEKEKAKEEPAPTPDEQANDGIPPASFPLLVSTLASQALSGLGAIPDPIENRPILRLDLAKHMIDKFVKNTAREVSIDYIQKVVCDYFDLPIELLKSKTRKREIVQARQISMYFAKKMTKSSLANIGLHCGGKDHATVLHACRTVNNLSETDKHFRKYLEDLEKKLAIH